MLISEVTFFDYFLIIMSFVSVYFAWKKGFVETFIDLLAWAGSLLLVMDNYHQVYDLANKFIPSSLICAFIASFCFYIILVIFLSFIGNKFINSFGKFSGSNADKILGVAIGFTRGLLFAILIYTVTTSIGNSFFKGQPEWLTNSKSYNILKVSSESLLNLLSSSNFKNKLISSIQEENIPDNQNYHRLKQSNNLKIKLKEQDENLISDKDLDEFEY